MNLVVELFYDVALSFLIQDSRHRNVGRASKSLRVWLHQNRINIRVYERISKL